MAITILTLRLAFMSAGVISTALILNLSFPLLINFLNCEIPYLWAVAVIWLKPPYLYLVLNCIIITIVASTKLQPLKHDADGLPLPPIPLQIKVHEDVIFADPSLVKPLSNPVDSDSVVSSLTFEYAHELPEEKLPEPMPTIAGVPEMETEKEEFVKPLVSKRFRNRKSVKATTPEGGKVQLGVTTKPKRQETMESTWRMITEGRSMPLTRHLKKSDTWDTRDDDSPATSNAPSMKKAEAFNEHSNSELGGGSGRVRREPSLSQDELNRRVEAFIRKFNEEMRLQRLQSLQQYSEMVGGDGESTA